MIHIVLFIIKIIGIVLLSVLGILALALICVMFVPVRYRVKISRSEIEGSPPARVCVKVVWLLHFINVLVRYPAKVTVRARILFFTLFRIPAKEKKNKKIKKNKKNEKNKSAKKSVPAPEEKAGQDTEAETIKGAAEAQATAEKTQAAEEEQNAAEEAEATVEEAQVTAEEAAPKKSLADKIRDCACRIRDILLKIKKFFENIQYTIRNFCDKIKAAFNNIQYYREVLESDAFRSSLQLCKGELGRVLRKLKPDKFEADLIVGMEDPATTGEILAIFGILYPLIGQHVRIVGDFECNATHIEGELYIRGRIRVFTFIRMALRLYFNQDIRKMLRLFKKEAV